MQEQEPAPTQLERPPDRKRDAGLSDEQFGTGVAALVTVFVLGFALLGMVLLSAKRRDRDTQ